MSYSQVMGGLGAQINAVANRERRFQRQALGTAVARPRLLGGTIRTVRAPRPLTGAEAAAPTS